MCAPYNNYTQLTNYYSVYKLSMFIIVQILLCTSFVCSRALSEGVCACVYYNYYALGTVDGTYVDGLCV